VVVLVTTPCPVVSPELRPRYGRASESVTIPLMDAGTACLPAITKLPELPRLREAVTASSYKDERRREGEHAKFLREFTTGVSGPGEVALLYREE